MPSQFEHQQRQQKRFSSKQEMEEFVVRFEIPYRKGHPSDEDLKIHVKLLHVLTEVFNETELRIFDDKSQCIKEFDQEKWLDKSYYQSHFNFHVDTPPKARLSWHT
jgi:hypothetical protein